MQPYLDGIFLPYALGSAFWRGAVGVVPGLYAALPSEDSFNIAGAMLANGVAFALACVVFYATILRMTRSVVIAAITAIALFLTPQMIAINLLRVDYLIILPVTAILYCSMRIAQNDANDGTAVLLGIVAALAATMKINGLFFLTLPIFAAGATLVTQRPIWALLRVVLIAMAAFVGGYTLLMFRYWLFLSPIGLIELYRRIMTDVSQWGSLEPSSWTILYYNFDLVLPAGWLFIALYLSCGVIVGIYTTRRNPIATFLFVTLVLWSFGTNMTLKYPRGGYHLVPIFLACIAFVAAQAWNWRVWLRIPALTVIAIVMASTISRSFALYEQRVGAMLDEQDAIKLVKRAPREWLAAHTHNSERICVDKHSEWAIPPMTGLKVTLTYGPFTFPYLDQNAMAQFEPPSLEQTAAQCDLIVLENFHHEFYLERIRRTNVENFRRWSEFYGRIIERWPPRVYESPTPANGIVRVMIYDLRGN